jgi:uncharacterized protein (TIGR02145 family)
MNMNKLFIFLIFNILIINFTYSQGISVNTTGAAADNSAMLDISSTSQGLLIPRMTTEERDGIASPALSLLIFNITTNCFEAYVNGNWYSVSCPPPCTSPSVPSAGTNTTSITQIVWNWNTVTEATGYKWNTANDYTTAIDNVTITTYTQPGLKCDSTYILYVWAYNSCGNSSDISLTQYLPCCTQPACGTQIWACANLNVGTQISTGINQTNYQKWCYNDLAANCDTYGGLYQWGNLMLGASSVDCDPCGPTTGHGGVKGICPAGYHIPTNSEWNRYEYCAENFIEPKGNTPLTIFQSAVPGDFRGSATRGVGPGDKMKVTISNTPTWDGTNASGFGALPGGYYHGSNIAMGRAAIYMTATEYNNDTAWLRNMLTDEARVGHGNIHKFINFGGASVRCLQD